VARHDRQRAWRQVTLRDLQVCPADAAGGHPEEQLVRGRLRYGPLAETNVIEARAAGFHEGEGLHSTMLPPIALLLPLYQIMNTLGLSDTPLALIIIYSSFVTPYVVWLMRGYLDTVPRELDDAARVDGCSRLGALWRVILPVSRPGLLSTALLAFLLAWDEFLYALVITQTNASKTLPVALNDFIGRYGVDFGRLAAGGVIAAIPPVIIAFVFQRYIVAGLTAGSVKG
jgi:multiple sugar transport system permease protein